MGRTSLKAIEENHMPCASCQPQTCFTGQGEMPPGCPDQNREPREIQEPSDGYINYVSKVGDKEINRLSELIEYAAFRGYKKVGIAGCIGLHDELRVITDVFKNSGLSLSTVMCKTGSLEKKTVGVPAKNRMTTESGYGIGIIACNPVAQALLLNREETELNCIVGLCAGHDSIFMKYSKAPVITLIAKDRSNSHNPASILYNFYGDNFFGRRPSPQGSTEFNKKHIKPIDIFRMLRKKRRSR